MLPACFLHASCMLPSILLLQEQAWLVHSRKHPSFSLKLNWTETHTIWSTFLGSTHKAHMGATYVLPSVASLTGRAVQIVQIFLTAQSAQNWKSMLRIWLRNPLFFFFVLCCCVPYHAATLKTSSFPCILSKLFHLWKMASLNNSRILAPGKAIWKMIYIPCMMEWSKAYFDGYRGWNLKDQDTTRFTF